VAYDEQLTVKVATLYYLRDLNQEDIADRLGLSRQSVGRHLKLARERGIVEFSVRSPLSCCSELEYRLESLFDLREAVVVSVPVDSEELLKSEVGRAAAAFLERRVQTADTVGVSWSSAVHACATRLKPTAARDVTVVPLNGSMNVAAYSTGADQILEKLARAFAGTSVAMAAPLLVDSPRILRSLLADSRIRGTFGLAQRANVAVFGIGCISKESSLYKAGYMDAEMLHALESKDARGDVCGHFFDSRGDICDRSLDERLLAVPRENLQAKSLSVAVAAGSGKVAAIRAALNGRWCNVLVTDEDTARAVTDLQERGAP
jgi:deoxyribonucleoside regulator